MYLTNVSGTSLVIERRLGDSTEAIEIEPSGSIVLPSGATIQVDRSRLSDVWIDALGETLVVVTAARPLPRSSS